MPKRQAIEVDDDDIDAMISETNAAVEEDATK
eukprot:SAG22_NODE_2708_length_2293_cov_1.318140_1_plen_31_part_10